MKSDAFNNKSSETPGIMIFDPGVSGMNFLEEKRDGGTQGREIVASNFEGAKRSERCSFQGYTNRQSGYVIHTRSSQING